MDKNHLTKISCFFRISCSCLFSNFRTAEYETLSTWLDLTFSQKSVWCFVFNNFPILKRIFQKLSKPYNLENSRKIFEEKRLNENGKKLFPKLKEQSRTWVLNCVTNFHTMIHKNYLLSSFVWLITDFLENCQGEESAENFPLFILT